MVKSVSGMRRQSVCFVCGISCVGGEASEYVFCVWYKLRGG